MRLPGAERDCGPLLELDLIRRQLHLGTAVAEGTDTIAVAQIIGTTGRVRDFDGCFRPLRPSLRKRIDEILEAAPPALDEAIEVVRVDRAYFVSDGHKRVAIAHRTGREYIDARVSHLPTPYALSPEVELDAIERTAREGEFRRHSGLAEAVPEARFALTDVSGYGELLLAVQGFSFDRAQTLGRLLSSADGARHWYEHRYLPGVASGREAVGDLLDAWTDADVFLMLHRHERGAWGSTCNEPECVADMLLAEQRRTEAERRSPLDRFLGRDTRPKQTPAPLLPLADLHEDTATDS